MDCIAYEGAHGKRLTIEISPEDMRHAEACYRGHSPNDPFLRAYEPAILVHATSREAFKAIRADGMLKSWSRLYEEGRIQESAPIGATLGDPDDYRDYIMFGTSGVQSEIVVASRQHGKIEMDIDRPYAPDARLYFDGAAMARDGLLTRDSAHIKVRDVLPLSPYCIAIATPESLGLGPESTPRIFAARRCTAPAERRITMSDTKALQELPNLGPVVSEQLCEVGLPTPEALREAGAKEAWLRIYRIDPSACYNRLMGLEGAIRGIPKKELPQDVKDDLKAYYRQIKG